MHSKIVGGSTATRLIACPGSRALADKMPEQPGSTYANRGTLLHNSIAAILNGAAPADLLGTTYEGEVLTQELYDEKITPALQALESLDPANEMDITLESMVSFGKFLPGVFGSADLLGRLGSKAIVIDWKFGDGVAVTAEENKQMLFYAAAAMRSPETQWVFEAATEIECIIVQPPEVKRWVTTPKRVRQFELELKRAVKESETYSAKLAVGDHCRWCPAKPICPLMTGAVDRALKTAVEGLDAARIGAYLKNADLLEGWISSLRGLAVTMMEKGAPVPGWKLVAKRGVRKWVNDAQAIELLASRGVDPMEEKIISPAMAEKLLKEKLPEGFAVSVSSGSTIAPESDSRPPVLQLAQQLNAALAKIG